MSHFMHHNIRCVVEDFLPVPSNTVRERTTNFNTLTKSYFGPAYAKATKVQRAIQLSESLLVIENQTQLADIPFADRFLVVERWIIEAVNNEKLNQNSSHGVKTSTNFSSLQDMALYTSKLTVYAEVIMLKSCSWEAQIQKKASETFTDMVTDWCKTATKALKATEEQKRKRLKLTDDSTDPNVISETLNQKYHLQTTTKNESDLMALHRRNFQELDKLIAKGDLEWCSIEVMHSSKTGKHSAFAKVLESHNIHGMSDLSKSLTEETDTTDSTDGSRGIQIMAKRRSRNFLKLLGTRMNKSSTLKPR
eukprot:CCRYP_018131-RC/>CCRYP_018131-RC protein AED:0.33 eAED:0.33 QI:71/1/1/1/1/1/2/321/306